MERSRVRRSVTSGIKLKPLRNDDGLRNSLRMGRSTSVEEFSGWKGKTPSNPPLPFPLIRRGNPPDTNRCSSSSADGGGGGTSETPRSVDAVSQSVRNLPHLDLEDRESRPSARVRSHRGRRRSNNDRGQKILLVNQQTTVSTSEVLEDLTLSSSSDLLHQFRDGRQLTITTNIAPLRHRRCRRRKSRKTGSQSVASTHPVVTISHSRVLRIIPPIAHPPEDNEDAEQQQQQQGNARSSSHSVVKEGNDGSWKTNSSTNERVPSPRNPEMADVMEYIKNFDISSSGTSTPKTTTFSIRCKSGQTTTVESSLVDGYASSAHNLLPHLPPPTQNVCVRNNEQLKTKPVGRTFGAASKDERQRDLVGERNARKVTRVRHSTRTSHIEGGGDCYRETTAAAVSGFCRDRLKARKRRINSQTRLPKIAKDLSLPRESSMLKERKHLADRLTSTKRYDIEVREESAVYAAQKSKSPSVMNVQRQSKSISKSESVTPVAAASTGGSDSVGGMASYKTTLETEDSGLDTDRRGKDFLDSMMRMSVEGNSSPTVTSETRMADQVEGMQAPEVGKRSDDKMEEHVAVDEQRRVEASDNYRYESKTIGRRSDGSARELCLLIDSKSSTPAFLEPSQDLDNFSISSSPLGDELASLPGSPFYRQVLQRRSSSIDSSFSRPGSDFLEVPLLVVQPKDRSPGVCLLDEPLTESPPDNCPLNEDPFHGGDLQQQVVHRLSDSVQLPPVTPCQSPEEGVVMVSGEMDSRQELGCGIIWKPTMEVSAAAPQVSLTTEDGDDFAVWFGRRGSIFIEEKGAPPRTQQHQLGLLSLTTRNEQGQVSLAVPKPNNN